MTHKVESLLLEYYGWISPGFQKALSALDAQHAQRTHAEVEALWQDILDKDDRTSPAEYPDMALITFEEFAAAIKGTGQ